MRFTSALMAVVMLGACGGSAGEPDATAASTTTVAAGPVLDGSTLYGSFTLFDSKNSLGAMDDCSGGGGYDDFGPGMNVTVRDGDGTVIGTGSTRNIRNSETPAFAETLSDAKGALMYCVVVFEVDLVEEADFYQVEVGTRGDLTYSRAEMDEMGWFVELSLG